MSLPQPAVPSSTYTEEYYLRLTDGSAEYQSGHGRVIPDRIRIALREAGVRNGMRVLDLGCGAGELLVHLKRSGARTVGLDYSSAALRVARGSLPNALGPDIAKDLGLALSDGRCLPIASSSVDRVFMLDVVEHMTPVELHACLLEVKRILSPGGRLVIHTMPNTWYYAVGYPLFRIVQRLRGIRLPRDPRERFALSETHINEQNLVRLSAALRHAGFGARVWLENTRRFEERESSRFMAASMRILTEAPILKLVFCDDLYAVASRP